MNDTKQSVIAKAEQFSQWTIPSVFPVDGFSDGDLVIKPSQGLGAEAVNSLANRLAIALFANSYPFFRLELSQEAKKLSDSRFSKTGTDRRINEAERLAYKELKKLGLTDATLKVITLLIVTGNCCLYLPEDDKGMLEVITLRDYSVKRSRRGVLIELEVTEPRLYSTLSEGHREHLNRADNHKGYEADTIVQTTVKYVRTGNDEYTRTYKLDDVELDGEDKFTRETMPHQPLVWKLPVNSHYGVAYVEEFASEFKDYEKLMKAFVDGIYIATDVKYLVRPGSVTDIDDLVESDYGAFVQGIPDDVRPLDLRTGIDFNVLQAGIDRIEKRIGRAFLISGAQVRDAERVTAYEVSQVMQQLEKSLGGVFTALADGLQKPLASYSLRRLDPALTKDNGIELVIVTGAESLSRMGEMDNVLEWASSMLKLYPQQFSALVDVKAISEYTASARGIDPEKFLIAQDEQPPQDVQAMTNQIDGVT